jgi:CHAT domain-containing protein
LVFAGANRPDAPGRGLVTGEALVGLDLSGLELAVLSACETGLGDVAGGEGVFGLQKAFHLAGCRAVVASLWKVDDDATAALMGLLYRGLWVDRLGPREALRRAQLALCRHPELIGVLARKRGADFAETDLPAAAGGVAAAGPTTTTGQWAAFVLSGAGR